ncbi:hypothetical protein [Bradyrhizobium tropiciagri]|uniref:hypothetical protein n=1 Tax=Bradyrhizobium tropiciagri TaxID=312253 RepID=UPI00067AE39D|nr:hypothetical protein [Bradyrhizobium tropiciagri]
MAKWGRDEREWAYTGLCEALTSAGQANEAALLARLCLLLMEKCADVDGVMECLSQAQEAGFRPEADAK